MILKVLGKIMEGERSYIRCVLPILLNEVPKGSLRRYINRTQHMTIKVYGACFTLGEFLGCKVSSELSVLLGSFVAVYDDYCDEDRSNPTRIENFAREIFDISTINGRLTKTFYFKIKELLPPSKSPNFHDAFKQMNYGQILSLKQFKKDASPEEIEEAIHVKAENSGRWLGYSVKHTASPLEDTFFREMGLFVQFTDDQDKKEGLRTLVTEGVLNEEGILRQLRKVEALALKINPSKADSIVKPMKMSLQHLSNAKKRSGSHAFENISMIFRGIKTYSRL